MMVKSTSSRLINLSHGFHRYRDFRKKHAEVMRLRPSPIQQKLATAQSALYRSIETRAQFLALTAV